MEDTGRFLLGRKCNKYGEDYESHIRKSDGMIIDKQHMIEKTAIESAQVMVMDKHYGELELNGEDYEN